MTFVFIFIGAIFTAMLITIMILVSKIEDLKEQLDHLKTNAENLKKRVYGLHVICGRYHGKKYFADLYEEMMDTLLNKSDDYERLLELRKEEFEGWLKKNPYLDPGVSVMDTKQVVVGVDLAKDEKEKEDEK